jgi:hypothetical protein
MSERTTLSEPYFSLEDAHRHPSWCSERFVVYLKRLANGTPNCPHPPVIRILGCVR